MKRLFCLILCAALLTTLFSGCASPAPIETTASPVIAPATTAPSILQTEVPEAATVPETTAVAESPLPAFTGLSDPNLLTYVEDDIYSSLEAQFASDDYVIEEVSASYISNEYLSELAYNSQKNIFFGYTLSELDEQFDGDRYVFTLGEDGTTVVQKLEVLEDDSYEQILKNVAIGSGVILVCVTVSVASAGLGAPAAVTMVFTAAAKTGATFAASGACLSAASKAITTGYQTGDVKEAMKAAAVAGSEGFKWGAISGAITGGAGKAIQLRRTDTTTIPSPRESELRAIKKYHATEEQVTYLDGHEVPWGTPGGTRPDGIINHNGVLEALEVKRYDLSNSSNVGNLCATLKRQVTDRIVNLPEGSTQRIILDVKGRNFSQDVIDSAISRIRLALRDVDPNIIIDIMR